MDLDTLIKYVDYSLSAGADYTDIRFQEYVYEFLRAEDGELREFSRSLKRGLGIRVLVRGSLGFSSTNSMDRESIETAIKRAISAARASEGGVKFPERKGIKLSEASP